MLKTVSSITNAIGALNYKGTWNASTNTPTLADGTGAKGDYYVVSTAGTQTFGGIQLFFGAGDWIVYNGAVWQRVEGGSDGNFANVTLTSTDAGATAAPLLDLYRDSASPAASDTLGEIEFNGEDSAGNKQAYGLIHASILSPTSTAEQGQLHFETATAGALTEKMIIGTTNLVINEIGAVFNVRIEGDTDANLFYTDATNDKVGIGTASPAEKLDVVGKIKASDNLVIGTTGKGLTTGSSIPLGLGTNTSTSQATITTAGVFLLPKTVSDAFATPGTELYPDGGVYFCRNAAQAIHISRLTSDGDVVGFYRSGSNVGSISITTLATSYNTISDYRLKNNQAPMSGSGAFIDALQPKTWNWAQDSSKGAGFVAHEFQEVCPSSVNGAKDAVDEDGEPVYQSMQASSAEMIANLVAEIQDLRKRLAAAGI
jgi:predicted RecA/RadA family phage recombinase